MINLLQINDITLEIENRKILKGIDFHVDKGEFISLIGPNGSGKSTIIKVISRLIKNNGGKVLVLGKAHDTYKNKEFSKIISTMFQHNAISSEITVYDIISYGRSPHKGLFKSLNEEDKDLIDKFMCVAGLNGLKDKRLSSLSGGELQRVYLISCLVQEPDVLILDEPTNHLDILHQYRLLSLIKEQSVAHNISVICVLHDINQAIKYSDRLLILKDGEIKHDGKAMDIITEEVILDVYGINSKIYKDENGMHVDFFYA